MASEMTLGTILAMHDGTALAAALRYTLAQTHDARLEAVRTAIDHACNELEVNSHLKQGLSEDQLTIEICQYMRALGFEPRHDEQAGGHCDILIRGKDMFMWVAEAKWHTSYPWLEQGFQQRATRYSPGVPGQDQGEVIIYCKNRDALAMLGKWRTELTARNAAVETADDENGNPLVFWSSHKHEKTGLEYRVRHKVVALHHEPADKKKAA